MPEEATEPVRILGRELVTRLAPEELPLYASLAAGLDGGKASRHKRRSGDRVLGFGVGEAVALLTPALLEFAKGLWDALAAEAVGAAVHSVLRHRRDGVHDNAAPLSAAQLRRVRQAAVEQALRLDFSENQASVLADAVTGILAAPEAS